MWWGSVECVCCLIFYNMLCGFLFVGWENFCYDVGMERIFDVYMCVGVYRVVCFCCFVVDVGVWCSGFV